MNNPNFNFKFARGKNSYTLGRKHPLVEKSNVLFSSMANPNIYRKQIKPTPPKPLDPNLYANLNKLLVKYGLANSNQLLGTLNKGYWELLYQDKNTGIWYDYASDEMTIQNIDPSNYDYTSGIPDYISAIVENGKRFTYYTESYLIPPSLPDNEQWPPTKQVPFKNNPNLTSTITLIATLESLAQEFYVPRTVSRTSCFVFGPSATCYFLIYKPPETEAAIYCMQTWTNANYTELDPLTNMCYLNTYLSLPEYWTFTQCILASDAMIALFSNPALGISAQVISDNIGNSYQYVRPEEAPFLYDSI